VSGFFDAACSCLTDWWSGAGDLKIVDCEDEDSDDNDEGDETSAGRRVKVVFRLYASTQSDIDKVIKDIEELGKEAVTDRVLDTAEHQAHIAKLTADQVLKSCFCERERKLHDSAKNSLLTTVN